MSPPMSQVRTYICTYCLYHQYLVTIFPKTVLHFEIAFCDQYSSYTAYQYSLCTYIIAKYFGMPVYAYVHKKSLSCKGYELATYCMYICSSA